MKNITTHFRRFLDNEQGMTLPLLAVSMVAITAVTGMAIDVGRLQMVQSKLQSSLDAAGLAAGATVSTSSVQTEMNKYLSSNFNNYMGSQITASSVVADSTNTNFTLSATATLPTTFLGVIGINTMTANANSQITRAIAGLELVFVLDNTGSMNNSAGGGVSKIQALQTSVTTLVNTLWGSGGTATNLWVGVVPFSQAVNIGTTHPTWMNTTYDATITDWGPGGSWGGCVDARLNGEDVIDDPPVTGNSNTLFEQYYWTSDNLNTDGVSNWGYNQWKFPKYKHGVLTGYTYSSPLGPLTGGPNYLCPQKILPMTNIKSSVTTEVSNMVAEGDTLINQGLIWGWNMLSPRWRGSWADGSADSAIMASNGLPLDYGAKNMNKAIVLLTDGENTIDDGAHGSYWFLDDNRLGTTDPTGSITELNNRTLQVCNAMKAKGIYIYTIALGTDVTPDSLALLQSCATASNYFFNSPSTTQLQTIFNTIGDSLSNLRVAK